MSEQKGHPGGHPGGNPGGERPGGPPSGMMNMKVDIADVAQIEERGAGGATSDKRVYLQLLAFTGAAETESLVDALKESGMEAVLYADANDPWGVGLLTFAEDPEFFVTTLRDFLRDGPFAELDLDPAFTMMGRSYALGYEPNLESYLLDRPRRTANNPAMPWAVFYPLRRTGAFAKLDKKEQGLILMEHGVIGKAFGDAGLATDIRLTCYGIDRNDNDFVIGLIGPTLFPLSKIVETMRKTRQTSEYMEKMGPFFVGRAIYQSHPRPA